MAYSRTRARDADREAAIELVNAAYADGQITDVERSERSNRLRAARTFADLDAQLVDLQRPGESRWQAPVPAARTAPAPGRAAAAFVVIAAVIGMLFVMFQIFDDPDPETPLGAASQPEAETVIDLYTTEGFTQLTEATQEKFGTTKVTSVHLYGGYASVTVVIDRSKRRYATWMYDGAWDEWDVGTVSDSDDIRYIDLATLNSAAIAPAMTRVSAAVDEPESVSVTIRPMSWVPGACIDVSARNRFDDSESIYLSCAGDVVEDD